MAVAFLSPAAPKVSSGPWYLCKVYFGPCNFDFVFITDLFKLKFYCFQLCPSIKTDYIRSVYFSPYSLDFLFTSYSLNYSGPDVLISVIWSSNWNWLYIQRFISVPLLLIFLYNDSNCHYLFLVLQVFFFNCILQLEWFLYMSFFISVLILLNFFIGY